MRSAKLQATVQNKIRFGDLSPGDAFRIVGDDRLYIKCETLIYSKNGSNYTSLRLEDGSHWSVSDDYVVFFVPNAIVYH